MKTRLTVLLAFLAAASAAFAAAPKRPNFLWLLIEDSSPSAYSCYGEQKAALTPNSDRLAAEDARAAEVATLRLFADLTLQQIAEVIGTTVPTAHRKWVYAKAFLRKELSA